MRISNSGLALIRLFEGLRLEAYRNFPGEPWTIGYGHTGPDVTAGKRISNDEAEQLLLADVARFEQSVRDNVGVPITQNQFDALVSLAYNIGTGAFERSTLLRKLNAGDHAGAANEFLRWNKVGDQVVQGLRNRRERERELFLRGLTEPMQPIPAEAVTEPIVAPPIAGASTTTAPPAPAYDDFGQPREVSMPLPIAATVAAAVVPELLKLLPWHKAEAKGINTAAVQQAIVEAAKAASSKPTLEEAAIAVTTDPAARERFVQAAAVRWADIAPALQFDEQSREKAREFADRVTSTGPEWRQIGAGAVIGILAIVVVIGGGAMFFQFMHSAGVSGEQKAMILGALISAFGTVLSYFFGSSSSSRAKDVAMAQAIERK